MQKQPYPMVLEAIRQEYTYDPDTGLIYRKGQQVGAKLHQRVSVCVAISHPEYLTIFCNLPAHQIAWYLTHGVWADKIIDHIDGDPHNNRLANLRLATEQENARNVRKRTSRTYTSQYKGVYWRKNRIEGTGKWEATIRSLGNNVRLGRFDTEEEAARAYDSAAILIHGEFAKLNFPLLPLNHTQG